MTSKKPYSFSSCYVCPHGLTGPRVIAGYSNRTIAEEFCRKPTQNSWRFRTPSAKYTYYFSKSTPVAGKLRGTLLPGQHTAAGGHTASGDTRSNLVDKLVHHKDPNCRSWQVDIRFQSYSIAFKPLKLFD